MFESVCKTIPAYKRVPAMDVGGIQALFLNGPPYDGKPTKIFAYFSLPEGPAPVGGFPAMVLIHGGLGTAFYKWVRLWNERGYAAISMDTEGHIPVFDAKGKLLERKTHDFSGPANTNFEMDESRPVEDWFLYHAVSAAIIANSFLSSVPQIDTGRIGAAGISWGGVIASILAGADNRFAFIIPIYGSGGFHTGTGALSRIYQAHPSVAAVFEPLCFLSHANMPILFLNDDTDFAFDITCTAASAAACPNARMVIIHEWQHSQEHGCEPEEQYAFADSLCKGAPAFPLVSMDNGNVRMKNPPGIFVSDAALYYTPEEIEHDKNGMNLTNYIIVSVPFSGTSFPLRIPADAKAWYLTLTDNLGRRVSIV